MTTRARALARSVAFARAEAIASIELTEDGVTLVASCAIASATEVVRTPCSSWLTHSAAFASERAPRALDSVDARARPTVALALHVLNERERADEESYVATLPKDIDLVDSWDEKRLETLRGTETRARAAGRARFIQSIHAMLGSDAKVSQSDIAWALSMVSSRAVRSAVVPYALVPGCDLLDHSSTPNCELRRDAATHDVSAVTTRDVRAGEMLTLSYGGDEFTNDRALRMYGFAMDGNPNDERVVGTWTASHPAKPGRGLQFIRAHAQSLPKTALETFQIERASLELDAETNRLLEADAHWTRSVKALRRGQIEIIDAYLDALRAA